MFYTNSLLTEFQNACLTMPFASFANGLMALRLFAGIIVSVKLLFTICLLLYRAKISSRLPIIIMSMCKVTGFPLKLFLCMQVGVDFTMPQSSILSYYNCTTSRDNKHAALY